VAVRLTILGSGSSGNCAYVETDEARILVDAGFSARQIRERLASIGRVPENLTGILINSRTFRPYLRPVGAGGEIKVAGLLQSRHPGGNSLGLQNQWSSKKNPALTGLDGNDAKTRLDWRLFRTGDSFELNDVVVETFSIPHDAQDPVGFLLRAKRNQNWFCHGSGARDQAGD